MMGKTEREKALAGWETLVYLAFYLAESFAPRLEDGMIDARDIVIDTFTGGPLAPVRMRITHMPTNTSVEGTGRSSIALKRSLLAQLENKIKQEG